MAIGSEQDREAFIPGADNLEDQDGALLIGGRLAELLEDEQVGEVVVRHQERKAGKTSHDLFKLWKIFRDVDRYMRALQNDLKTSRQNAAR
ncbi:MAG TPA: hypothetical protein PLT37_03270 [Kiritimatiellia bacterium]|nr:hypothetical protein [Kiritimatiellia bacterium]OQC60272.1 MAG: hypothetical protein BWX54_00278 [Verrucomicrobia bacterium ADurb.Bin018]HQF20251.1 hypothetical protein [Kiritimatiellia bacterium]HQG74130.1 hypothetical protein [Kiritimatiellia bacterium]HQM22352.1 hypothetical protein [Kiritimatiellia bacterium]